LAINPLAYTACPHLAASTHRVTSPADRAYNCIAHAADDMFRWWCPIPPQLQAFLPKRLYYWPPGLPFVNTVDNYVAAYETIGYARCPDAAYEDGFEKIVIYARNGEVQHAAKQLSDHEWTSKLGDLEDIAHDSVDAVAGGLYGSAVAYVKRSVQASA